MAMKSVSTRTAPPWAFRSRLRRSAFGWRGSKPAIARIDEALAEIRAFARHDAALAAEVAVLFLEKVSHAQNAPFAPTTDDNCDNNVTLTWEDEYEQEELCDTIVISRHWTATDDAGNTSHCVQTLTVEPMSLDALQCPENYIGECGQSLHPSVTGWPTIDGIPVVEGGVCNIFVGYWDQELADCGGGIKIVRRWSILDWCAQEIEECVKIH